MLKLSLTNKYAFHERLVTSLQIHICVSSFFSAMIQSGCDYFHSI